MFSAQAAEHLEEARTEAERLRKEVASSAAALDARTVALSRQEAAVGEQQASMLARIKELQHREVQKILKPPNQ